MITIYQNPLKFIKILLLIATLLPVLANGKTVFEIKNPKGEVITLRLATTREQHSKGLSKKKKKDFSNKEGMLFVNEAMGTRRFWMPDTYFNLNIVFLDSDLKVVGLEMNAPSHPGTFEPPVIFRTKSYQAQFVLETNAIAPFTKDLNVGDKLIWTGTNSLSEIVLKTRQMQ